MRKKLIGVVILAFFISIVVISCGMNNTTRTFSIEIIGEDDSGLLEEKDLSIICSNNDTLTYKECILYVLARDEVKYELSDDGKRIKSMYGYTEYFDEPYDDRGAYWYMELNHNQIIDMLEAKINDGDVIKITWKVFDRHNFNN